MSSTKKREKKTRKAIFYLRTQKTLVETELEWKLD